MSRSKPSDNTPNPSQRWHEWDGSNGLVRYYDKDAVNLKDKTKKGENVACKLPFTFLLLDETSTVKGWHDASDSGIYANEVRDTRDGVLLVKAFKGGVLAEGFYSQIRDRVAAHGGCFTLNLYIGFKDAAGALQIGALQLKGASLNSWVEFRKANREAVYKKAVQITGFVQGKKGNISFRTPTFAIKDVSEATATEAFTLDTVLQAYLKGYFSRVVSDKVTKPVGEGVQPDAPVENQTSPQGHGERHPHAPEHEQPESDDVPF